MIVGMTVALLLSDNFRTTKPNRKTDMKMRIPKLALGGLCAIAFAVQPAKAIQYTLTSPNAQLSSYSGPYGTVDVQLVGNTATITFTSLNGYLFGDGSSVGVNVNGSYLNPTIISDGSPSQFKDWTSSPPPVDGRGDFSLILDNMDFSNPLSMISFSITGTWANDASVLALNNNGFVAEAHVQAPNSGGVTGYVGATDSVPDGGSTVALLGCGLAGIGMISRKFRKS